MKNIYLVVEKTWTSQRNISAHAFFEDAQKRVNELERAKTFNNEYDMYYVDEMEIDGYESFEA